MFNWPELGHVVSAAKKVKKFPTFLGFVVGKREDLGIGGGKSVGSVNQQG